MGRFDKVIVELRNEVARRYGGRRLELHINSVAEFARKSAEKIDPGNTALAEKVYVAGLAHDLYKGWEKQSLREFVASERVPVDSDTWRIGRGLLHAPAAAHHLRARMGVSDRDIYEAVYYHTTGHPGAGPVEKILFCSDYLEPHRPNRAEETDTGDLARRMNRALDEVYREILARKISYTVRKGWPVHPNGLAALNEAILASKVQKKSRQKD